MIYGLTMKPDEKAAWVAALRSGKYEQGKGTLCSADRHYCCLGVHSEIKKVAKKETPVDFNFHYPTGGVAASVPDKEWFATFFEFTPNSKLKNKILAVDKLIDACTTMNDGSSVKRAKSFKQIADWIEKKL